MATEYEHVPHHFIKWPPFVQPVCTGCGLLAVNNDFTRWAVKKGCDWKYHPGFRNARHIFTRD